MDSPFSEQHWFGCLATGRHEPQGLMQQWKIMKFLLQLFRAMILPMCCQFSEHGSCATKSWCETIRSASEPQAQTGPLCLLWSRCTRALIGESSLLPDCYGLQCCWNTESSALKELKPVPRTRLDLTRSITWPCMTVSITPNWVCCGVGVVMSVWRGIPLMLKSTLATGRHRATTSYSLPPEGHKPCKYRTGPKNLL